MDFYEILTKYVLPGIAIALFLIERVKQAKKARTAEAAWNEKLIKDNDKRIEEIHDQYRNQITYLEEQLDDCLDASRPKRPDIK